LWRGVLAVEDRRERRCPAFAVLCPGAVLPSGAAEELETTWHAHYRARLGDDAAFDDRLFEPDGLRRPIAFQQVPETKAGKNRLHLDPYLTGHDDALPLGRWVEIVEAKVFEPVGLGARVERRARGDDPEDPFCYVVMHDPEATSSA
jgi:hypothetical protein